MHDVIDILTNLRGKTVWNGMGGPVHGPALGLELGGMRERKVPLTNPWISEELRRFEGEYALFITCAWRLALNDRIVCGSLSRNEPDGDIVTAVAKLTGKTIVDVEVNREFLDFTLRFGDAQLAVFCDEVDAHEGRDNYHVTLQDSLVIVGCGSVVRSEPRTFDFRPPLRSV